jgi:hypothetical protein
MKESFLLHALTLRKKEQKEPHIPTSPTPKGFLQEAC